MKEKDGSQGVPFRVAACAVLVVALSGCHTSGAAQNGEASALPPRQIEAYGLEDVAMRGSGKYRVCVLAAKDEPRYLDKCLIDELAYQQRAVGRIFYDVASRLDSEKLSVLRKQERKWKVETDGQCGDDRNNRAAWSRGIACRTGRLIDRYEELSRQRTEIGVSSWSEAQPDETGQLVMVLDDVQIAMQSQDCEIAYTRVYCSDVRLTLVAPDRSPQTLSLDEVVLPRRMDSPRPSETGVHGPLDRGFVEERYGVMLTDVNFDGHDDLMLWTGSDGTYGDPSYTYFIFDPAAGRLVENIAIAEAMMGHSLSRVVDGQLFAWYRSGPCERGEKTIDVRGAAPVIVERRDYNTCEGDTPW